LVVVPTLGDLTNLALPAEQNTGALYYTEGYSASGDGGGGFWRFDAADCSTDVSADSLQGVVAAPNAASSGTSGAWRRIILGPADPRWWGATLYTTVSAAKAASGTGEAAKLQAWIDYLRNNHQEGRPPPGFFKTLAELDLYNAEGAQGFSIIGSNPVNGEFV